MVKLKPTVAPFWILYSLLQMLESDAAENESRNQAAKRFFSVSRRRHDVTRTRRELDRERELIFTSVVEPPFLIEKFHKQNGKVSSEFVGFIPDLVAKIAKRLKMPYSLKVVSKGGYGTMQPDGSFNGMLGEIISGKADVGAGALTTHEWRMRHVTFTRPFMAAGIATVLAQPPDGEPMPIRSPFDLLNQSGISYGCIRGSLTHHFFRTSNDSRVQALWRRMRAARPSVLRNSAIDGIESVRHGNGKFAFFVENAFGEYIAGHEPCDTVLLDELLQPAHYALAVPHSSALLGRLNRILRRLDEAGAIEKLRQKWWQGSCGLLQQRRDVIRTQNQNGGQRPSSTEGVLIILTPRPASTPRPPPRRTTPRARHRNRSRYRNASSPPQHHTLLFVLSTMISFLSLR